MPDSARSRTGTRTPTRNPLGNGPVAGLASNIPALPPRLWPSSQSAAKQTGTTASDGADREKETNSRRRGGLPSEAWNRPRPSRSHYVLAFSQRKDTVFFCSDFSHDCGFSRREVRVCTHLPRRPAQERGRSTYAKRHTRLIKNPAAFRELIAAALICLGPRNCFASAKRSGTCATSESSSLITAARK